MDVGVVVVMSSASLVVVEVGARHLSAGVGVSSQAVAGSADPAARADR
jgi:hypothetical protein